MSRSHFEQDRGFVPLDPRHLRPVSRFAVRTTRYSELVDAARIATHRACAALQAELGVCVTCRARILDSHESTTNEPPLEGRCVVVLSLSAAGLPALLELDTGFVAAAVDRLAGGPGHLSAPAPLSETESAVTSYLLLVVLRAVRDVDLLEEHVCIRLAHVSPSPDRVALASEQARRWASIELDLSIGSTSGFGRLLLPELLAERVACSCPPRAADLPPALARAALPARLTTGDLHLTRGEVAGLRPGDVVVGLELAGPRDLVSGAAQLRFDTFHLKGRLEGSSFSPHVTRTDLGPEAPMPTVPQVPPLPVEIEVELARTTIPLSDLVHLDAGAVLRLDLSLSDSVTLRIGGRPVARAELVDIEGEVGARILELLS